MSGREAQGLTPVSRAWFERALAVTPGGVNSPVRAFGSVGGTPRFMVRGQGAWLWDADGNDYVDLVGTWGPAIVGHAHPRVIEATIAAAGRGLSFGTPGTGEVELAEEICARIDPVEQVRLVSSGTEATMSAIRLARGFTHRPAVIKFAGCYHGHVDALLAAAGSGVATFALPDSAGVPTSTTADVIVLPYNDLAAVQAAFAAHPGRIAAIITEAVPANMGVVPPDDGFNAALRELAHAAGALLISDEVMTGFRVSARGQWGRDGAIEGWAPDLITFGKVIGGGLPVGAFGGRAEIMGLLAPNGPVYQAGTLSGNPVTTAAGLATLRTCDADLYRRLDAASAQVQELATQALTAAGVPHRIQRAGSLFSVFFTGDAVRDYAGAQRTDTARYAAFFHACLAGGVYLPPSAFEAWFVSGAHDEQAIERIGRVLPVAARAAGQVGGN